MTWAQSHESSAASAQGGIPLIQSAELQRTLAIEAAVDALYEGLPACPQH